MNIPNLPKFLGLSIVVWLILLFLIAQIGLDKFQIFEINNTRPNLIIKDIEVNHFPITEYQHKIDPAQKYFGGTALESGSYLPVIRSYGSTDNFIEIKDNYAIGVLKVENKKLEKYNVIKSLTTQALMFFYDENKKPINDRQGIKARWSMVEISRLTTPQEPFYSLEIDIPAGSERELCLIAKHPLESNCYIFNQETYLQHKLKRDEASLNQGKMYLKIVIFSENSKNNVETWFELDNPGIGDFSIKPYAFVKAKH